MSANNEYMKEYMLARYHKRRDLAFSILGNSCKVCGRSERLEIDHVYPEEKSFSVGKVLNSISLVNLLDEIVKCQILCYECHKKKHECLHGTISSYRYCKCLECKKAKRDWTKEYRKKRVKP